MRSDREWIERTLRHEETFAVPYNFMFSPPARRAAEAWYGADLEQRLALPVRMSGCTSVKPLYADPAQFGKTVVDEFGVAHHGLIVRHLILPNGLSGSEESLTWLARELSPTVTVSLMSQYSPLHRAQRIPLLSRRISVIEYETVIRLLHDMGIESGWIQEMRTGVNYIPDFEREGHPFFATPKRQK